MLGGSWAIALRAGAAPASPCQPNEVFVSDQCAYVLEHAEDCWPDGGFDYYLRIHYCWFAPEWRWASVLLLLLALALTLGFLQTAAERFFCPALELIAEHLRMPPAVAGATLLSFGNGAPDVFTMLAAVKQLDQPAIGMALSEPVGGGLFTSNVVFAAVVLLSARSHKLQVHRALLMKDLVFYLWAVSTILWTISDSKVEWYEATALAASYVLYVCATWWLARSDAPVRTASTQHEQGGEWLGGGLLSESESVWGDEQQAPVQRRLGRDLEDGFRDDSALGDTGALRQPLLPPRSEAGVGVATPTQRISGETPFSSSSSHFAGRNAASAGVSHSPKALAPEAAVAVAAAACAAAASAVAAAAVAAPAGDEAGDIGSGASGGAWHAAAARSAQHAAAAAFLARGGGNGGGGGDGGGSGGSSPKWSVGGSPRAREHKHKKRSLKRRLQQPLMQLMQWTMPKIGISPRYKYPRPMAAALPLTAPLLLLALDPEIAQLVTWGGVAWAAGTALLASAMVWSLYPADSIPRAPLKGVFAVLSFALSMVWLKVSADTLVHVCMVLGTIFGAPPALLGATVLAWGNSMPDMANNLALARDGYPTMATTACFAAPLFSLLVGASTSLAYGAFAAGGVLEVPFDKMLAVMYGFAVINLAKYCVLIPLVHKWVLGRGLAITALAFYAVYTLTYCLVVAGMI